MSITRVNFNPIGSGGDNPTSALVKLDNNDADLDNRVTAAQSAATSAQSAASAAQTTADAAAPKATLTGAGIAAAAPSGDINGSPLGTFTAYTTSTWTGNEPDSQGSSDGTPSHFNIISWGVGSASAVAGARKSIVALEAYDTSAYWPRMWFRAFHDTNVSPFAEVQTDRKPILPFSDNSYSIGDAGHRYTQIFSASGTISTSDERAKNILGNSDLGLDFILSLEPVKYTFKVRENVPTRVPTGKKVTIDDPETGATKEVDEYVTQFIPDQGKRTHYGLRAQQVNEALEKAGATPSACAIWTLADPSDPDSSQGLRYEELIAPLINAVQEQNALIVSLAARFAALEAAPATAAGS